MHAVIHTWYVCVESLDNFSELGREAGWEIGPRRIGALLPDVVQPQTISGAASRGEVWNWAEERSSSRPIDFYRPRVQCLAPTSLLMSWHESSRITLSLSMGLISVSTEFPIPTFVKFRHVLFWELRFAVSFCPRRPPRCNSLKLSQNISTNDGMVNSVCNI